MRTWLSTVLTMAIALTAQHARAQTYDPAFPVCRYVVGLGLSPYYRCSYATMDQCRASANGQMCVVNPYYAGAQGNNRRHRGSIGSSSSARSETGSYALPQRPRRSRVTPYHQSDEPYYGASQGYAPGEKQRFLEGVRQSL
ncbi:DUF3551 domain-containing protein [Bradyrhizobium manausense]|uniref:DUF3551 domain-containing protein n=1 Tax=Bradyrhizobium manausense TaxID=989370 RepID=UPI001BA53465|nr:DUF3551 domain-containing protein [Bradyrhizobium manausense]MBR1089621.1 DUF3551 domain-containing protein [Bradyrhizobium manausense]